MWKRSPCDEAPHRPVPHPALGRPSVTGSGCSSPSNGDVPLPKEVPHWDYQTILELAAPVSVDRRAVTEACQLDFDSGLAVLVMARSNHTNAEILAARLDLPMSRHVRPRRRPPPRWARPSEGA